MCLCCEQRQKLRVVAVSECLYSWADIDGRFWVYGRETAVYAPDYPQKHCWGCAILWTTCSAFYTSSTTAEWCSSILTDTTGLLCHSNCAVKLDFRVCKETKLCLRWRHAREKFPFRRHQAWARAGKPPKCRLAPAVKHTGQESGGELCEIVKFWSFLQSKSANDVCKLLQYINTASGGLCPQTPYQGFAPGPHWGLPFPRPPGL